LDLLDISGRIADTWRARAPTASRPVLVGPDNGWSDMAAAHLDAILNVSAAVMYAASFHAYDGEKTAWGPT